MTYYQRKFPKSLFFVLLILFISFLGVFGLFRLLDFSPFLAIENASIKTFQPIILYARKTSISINQKWTLLINLSAIQQKLEDLEYQIQFSKIQSALNDNLITENYQLKSWLGLIKESDYVIEAADVVYRDKDNGYNFTISKGLSNKIMKGYPVILKISLDDKENIIKLCLIGRIDQVNQNNAHILSLLDKKSKISVKNLRTQVNGTIEYDANKKELYFSTLRDDKDFKIGDLIVTNEMSQFPKDLIIGYIESEEEVSFNNKFKLQLPFDLLTPSQVGVIIP